MSSDDPSRAGLLPDYEVPWEQLVKDLVKFVLSKQVYVKTWSNQERAIIKSKGHVLGQVVSVQSDDRHKVTILFRGMPEQPGYETQWRALWTLQASAKRVREGDIVCLLQGAQMPIIIRQYHDYFTVIRIAVSLAGKPIDGRDVKWSTLLRSITTFPRDFLLIWTWEDSLGRPQEPPEDHTLVRMNTWVSEFLEAESRGHLDKAIRIWNVAVILDDIEEYGKADERIREAVEGYEIGLKQEHLHTQSNRYCRTPLSWASRNGIKL
jgi:hypothetical protein